MFVYDDCIILTAGHLVIVFLGLNSSSTPLFSLKLKENDSLDSTGKLDSISVLEHC
jgi:hypothetical protein